MWNGWSWKKSREGLNSILRRDIDVNAEQIPLVLTGILVYAGLNMSKNAVNMGQSFGN